METTTNPILDKIMADLQATIDKGKACEPILAQAKLAQATMDMLIKKKESHKTGYNLAKTVPCSICGKMFSPQGINLHMKHLHSATTV